MRPSIRRKLGGGIGLLLILIFITGMVSLLQTRVITKKVEDITEEKEPASAAAYEMEINLIGTGFALLGYLHDHDPRHLDRISEDEGEFEAFQMIYHKLAKTQGEKELGLKVDNGFEEFKGIADELIKIEDEQAQKMKDVAKNFEEMDAILDDKIQLSIEPDDPKVMEKTQASMEMEINVNGIAKGLGKFLMTHQIQYVDLIRDDEEDFRRFFKEYVSLPLSFQEQQWAEQVNGLFEENGKLVQEIIGMDGAKEKRLAEFVTLRRELDSVLDDEIQVLVHSGLSRAKREAFGAANRANVIIIAVIFLALASGIFAGTDIYRDISRPVSQLVRATEAIAKGDLTRRVNFDSANELGLLCEHFNYMTKELHRTMVSRDYMENIVQSMAESLIVVSPDRTIQSVNTATCNLLGYKKEELVEQSVEKIFTKEELVRLNFDDLIKREIVSTEEKTYLSKDGRIIPVLFSSAVLHGSNGKIQGYVWIAQDITERKEAEKELEKSRDTLRNLAAHVQSVKEEEKTRIAREIHDDLGQALTGLKMDMSYLEKRLPQDHKNLYERIQDASKLVSEAVQTTRNLISRLRPALLDDLGLIAALKWLSEDFQARTGIKCETNLELLGEIILNENQKIGLFRIFQETLTNVARHARATRVTTSAAEKEGNLEMVIEDDGIGIEEEKIRDSKTFGLIGIKERAISLGGDVEIEGTKGAGTTVSVRIPIRKSR